jgi:hypothetical protein
MGENEIFTSVNEEQDGATIVSIKERDSNIPIKAVNPDNHSWKDSREWVESKPERSSNLIEANEHDNDNDQDNLDPMQDAISNKTEKSERQDSIKSGEHDEQTPAAQVVNAEILNLFLTENITNKSEQQSDQFCEQTQCIDEGSQFNWEQTENASQEIDNNDLYVAELWLPTKSDDDLIETSEEPEQIEANFDSDSSPDHNNQDIIEALQLEDQNAENQNSLFEEDLLSQEKEDGDGVDPLELTTNSLSYERFYPGRILGNTFVARNNSSKPLKFTIKFENKGIDRLYVGEKLWEYYGIDSVNEIEDFYTKHLTEEVDVSDDSLNVWFIEDPYTKTLTQEVDFELPPYSEEEFIVVLKSRAINKQKIYAANVVLDRYESGLVNSVFCYGFLEKLKINIPKEMYNTKLDAKMIKIVMRRKQAAQSIKVLIENKGDMLIQSHFQSVEMEKNLQFYIPRDKVNIEPNSKALLEIKVIHKLGSQGSKKDGKANKPEIIHKLVVAKVKDCELKFSIIFEITII